MFIKLFYMITIGFIFLTGLLFGRMPIPIYSLLLIIGLFINGTFIIFGLGLSFLPILFLAIFLGAVIVLFLFAVMMLDIKEIPGMGEIWDIFSFRTFPILFIIFLFFNLLFFVIDNSFLLNILFIKQESFNIESSQILSFNVENFNFFKILYNTQVSLSALILNRIIFQSFVVSFLLIGFIALLVMVGVILVSIYDKRLQNSLIQEPIQQSLEIHYYKNII